MSRRMLRRDGNYRMEYETTTEKYVVDFLKGREWTEIFRCDSKKKTSDRFQFCVNKVKKGVVSVDDI